MLAPTLSRPARADDEPAISRLHGEVLGPGRFARSAYRVREGKGRLSRFCRVVELNGQLVAALRMTEVTIGGVPGAALLGPIVVASEHQSQGFGRLLIRDAIDAARGAGLRLVILVGDEPYYGRFGFQIIAEGQIVLPGPANPDRLLALELHDGTLARYCGIVAALTTGSLTKAAG